jgi:hypothetical protein
MPASSASAFDAFKSRASISRGSYDDSIHQRIRAGSAQLKLLSLTTGPSSRLLRRVIVNQCQRAWCSQTRSVSPLLEACRTSSRGRKRMSGTAEAGEPILAVTSVSRSVV